MTQATSQTSECLPQVMAVGQKWRYRWHTHKAVCLVILFLGVFTVGLLLVEFLAPYSEQYMHRANLFHPPTVVHWRDEDGHISWPYVYVYKQTDYMLRQYVTDESARKHYLKPFWRGESYQLLFGLISSDVHLFGVEAPATIYLLGADGLGRDVFSRLLYGGRRSLLLCLAGVLLSCCIGWFLGGLAGYYGGVIDSILTNTAYTLTCIPKMYLLIALMAYLPASNGSRNVVLIGALVLVNWPHICVTARNYVLNVRQQPYLEAARAAGAGNLHIIWRHVFPNCLWLMWVSMALCLPQMMLGESSLSLQGIGVQEPNASWGGMLGEALNLMVLVRFPWLLIPGVAIALTALCGSLIAETLHKAGRIS